MRATKKSNKGTNKDSNKAGIISISNRNMMLSLAEALFNSHKINEETYIQVKRLIKEEVND